MINIKRIYEKKGSRDGWRILVDRMWPRGLSKANANVDLWLKDVAPSTELRQWFGHDPKKWSEFKKRYFVELKTNKAFGELLAHVHRHNVTLLYAAKEEKYNNAMALKEFIDMRK